jgi:(2R)-sulfolactate sulfo-lyase subunit alpha
MEHTILMHETDDDVGVAIVDLKAGVEAHSVTLEGQHVGTVKVTQDIPLGHKVAMRDIPKGKEIVKYARPIGRATEAIAGGAHVHTHNLKSMRW